MKYILLLIIVCAVSYAIGKYFGKATHFKCETCINRNCVANNPICDYCNGVNKFKPDDKARMESEDKE